MGIAQQREQLPGGREPELDLGDAGEEVLEGGGVGQGHETTVNGQRSTVNGTNLVMLSRCLEGLVPLTVDRGLLTQFKRLRPPWRRRRPRPPACGGSAARWFRGAIREAPRRRSGHDRGETRRSGILRGDPVRWSA